MSGPDRPAAPAAALTDPGITRPSNEDAFLLEPPLYAVADGMGGHRAGEVASRVALDALLAEAPRRADAKALGRAVRAANRAVMASAESSRGRSGMGTTLTAAMLDGDSLVIGHVGDSRVYLLRAGRLTRLTDDHSMVADLVRQGTLSEEDARFHPQRSVITRALGSDENMRADTYEVRIEPGDRVLLCTDGLTTMLDDGAIADLLSRGEPAEAAAALVDAANRAGGYDNITVVVVDADGTPASELEPVAGTREAGRRIAARLLWIVAALALVTTAAWGAWGFARGRAFLVTEAGYVTVYRGIPGSFAGLGLAWRVERTDVPTDRLEVPVQSRLADGIAFADLADALERVEEMRAEAASTVPAPATLTTPAP